MSAAEKDFAPRTLLEKPAQLPLRSFHAENLPPTAAEGQKGMSYSDMITRSGLSDSAVQARSCA